MTCIFQNAWAAVLRQSDLPCLCVCVSPCGKLHCFSICSVSSLQSGKKLNCIGNGQHRQDSFFLMISSIFYSLSLSLSPSSTGSLVSLPNCCPVLCTREVVNAPPPPLPPVCVNLYFVFGSLCLRFLLEQAGGKGYIRGGKVCWNIGSWIKNNEDVVGR